MSRSWKSTLLLWRWTDKDGDAFADRKIGEPFVPAITSAIATVK